MTKRLFILLIVFLGAFDKVVAQGGGPPCPICPPETPQLSIEGLPLYISFTLAIIMGIVFYRKRLLNNSKEV